MPWKFKENFLGQWIFYIFIGYSWVMICCNPLKTSELWHHEIFGHEIHGFLSTFEKAMKCHFHGYFMASRSLYSIFHGSWIWKFSQVFHGIFQVFFMALRPWKCHWFNHENPVKNLWIYNELFHKIFMGFEFIEWFRSTYRSVVIITLLPKNIGQISFFCPFLKTNVMELVCWEFCW